MATPTTSARRAARPRARARHHPRPPTEAGPALRLAMDESDLMADRFVAGLLRPRVAVPRPRPALRAPLRALARRTWEDRVRSEYRGVLVVRHFHALLAELNAPLDVQELALLMMLQEQQHAALCMGPARALGHRGGVAFLETELQFHRTAAPAAQELMQMLCTTFVCGEVVALALIRHTLRALPSGPYRDVLRAVARDEVLHARLGPMLLGLSRQGRADWLPWPGDAAVRRMLGAALDTMRARDVVDPEDARGFGMPADARALLAVGVVPPAPMLAAYHRALDRDVPEAARVAGLRL